MGEENRPLPPRGEGVNAHVYRTVFLSRCCFSSQSHLIYKEVNRDLRFFKKKKQKDR